MSDLYLELFGEGGDALKEFVDKIANHELRRYQQIIQTGAKEGETLFAHVMNGIFLIERLRSLFEIDDLEARVLFSAYAVHDINKLPEFSSKPISFNELATDENILSALQELKIEEFFPEYRDYLPEIRTLVRGHSGHYHTSAETLHKSFSPYRLSKSRVEGDMLALMRAVDVVDLSKSLEEREHKRKFLTLINSRLHTQYRFVYHKLTEHRGIMSNLIHNRIAEYLKEEKGMIPLLFYPNGVAYLYPVDGRIEWDESDLDEIGRRVVESIESKTRGDFRQFIKNSPAGIKVDSKCLELGISFDEIFQEVRNIISGKNYSKKVDQMNAKLRERLRKFIEKPKKGMKGFVSIAKDLLNEDFKLPPDNESLRLGELVRTYYVFLKAHFKSLIADPWARIYKVLNIPQQQAIRYEVLEPLYDRGYAVGVDLSEAGYSFEDIYRKLISDGRTVLSSSAGFQSRFAVMSEYVSRYVDFSFDRHKREFKANLIKYMRENHKQCSVCGSEFETDLWMAGDVPLNIKVQYFSNRLEGGVVKDPKRYVCQICRTQFTLDRLCYKVSRDTKTYYIHLYPHSFFTDVFIEGFKRAQEKLLGENVSSVIIDTDDALRQLERGSSIRLKLKGSNVAGNPLPTFSESQGNILTVPVNAPGDNDSERFLFALENALIYKKLLGCRLTLTGSSIPPFVGDEFNEMFIDAFPPAFRGIISDNNLTTSESEKLLDQIITLHRINLRVRDPKRRENSMMTLIRAMDSEELELFHAVQKLIDRKFQSGQEALIFSTRREITPLIQEAIERKGEVKVMPYIKELAKIAWEGKLKGQTLADNSLAKPIDVAFDSLERWDKSKETEEEAIAVMSKEIARAIERVTPPKYFGERKLEKISEFVDVFFNKLFKEVYNGNLTEFLENSDRIRSAFLFFVVEQIKSKGKEEENGSS